MKHTILILLFLFYSHDLFSYDQSLVEFSNHSQGGTPHFPLKQRRDEIQQKRRAIVKVSLGLGKLDTLPVNHKKTKKVLERDSQANTLSSSSKDFMDQPSQTSVSGLHPLPGEFTRKDFLDQVNQKRKASIEAAFKLSRGEALNRLMSSAPRFDLNTPFERVNAWLHALLLKHENKQEGFQKEAPMHSVSSSVLKEKSEVNLNPFFPQGFHSLQTDHRESLPSQSPSLNPSPRLERVQLKLSASAGVKETPKKEGLQTASKANSISQESLTFTEKFLLSWTPFRVIGNKVDLQPRIRPLPVVVSQPKKTLSHPIRIHPPSVR